MRYLILLPAALVMFATGCTTFSSTLLERKDNDVLCKHDHLRLKGIPITVHVPSHLDVQITESYMVGKTENGLQEIKIPGGPVRGVVATPVMTKKIFVVDFKRPASGTLEYDLGFNQEQYLNKIANKIEDTTIADVRGLVMAAVPLLAGAPTSASAVEIDDSLSSLVSTANRDIAFRRFDIDSPTFEDELNWFLAEYVTNCNDCSGFMKPTIPGGLISSDDQTTLGLESQVVQGAVATEYAQPVFEDELVTVYSEVRQ